MSNCKIKIVKLKNEPFTISGAITIKNFFAYFLYKESKGGANKREYETFWMYDCKG